MRCECDWPATCGGLGVLVCGGCGGDLCVCPCGGEESCDGCAECEDDDIDEPTPNPEDVKE
jgi:hypothetical protein